MYFDFLRIEHLPIEDLTVLSELLFSSPNSSLREIIISTPNADFNPFIIGLSSTYRHHDHQFEWTRNEFKNWCIESLNRYNYSFQISNYFNESNIHQEKSFIVSVPDWTIQMDGVGYLNHIDKRLSGPCSQIAIFQRNIATHKLETELSIALNSNTLAQGMTFIKIYIIFQVYSLSL